MIRPFFILIFVLTLGIFSNAQEEGDFSFEISFGDRDNNEPKSGELYLLYIEGNADLKKSDRRVLELLDVIKKRDEVSFDILSKCTISEIRNFLDVNDYESVGVTVHESLHGLDFDLSGFDSVAYYISPTEMHKFALPKVFYSDLIAARIPAELRKVSSRYPVYLKARSERLRDVQVSIAHGFYGLLEEFSAYYHGNRIEYLLVKHGDLKVSEYVVTDVFESYYEFAVFMAVYLDYAKLKYPKDYQVLVEDLDLRKAYTRIYDLYAALLLEMQNNAVCANYFSTDFKKYLTPEYLETLEAFRLN